MTDTKTVIVRDTGFVPDDRADARPVPLDQLDPEGALAVDLAPGDDMTVLAGCLGRIDFIRIAFASFADGRGFTLARQLRAMGYAGRLRAAGHVLADQYAMARRAGFDEVEIDADLAARQPQDQWLARADWRVGDYQARLRGAATG